MKAIHNNNITANKLIVAVFNTSKIQNESNSQHSKQILCYLIAVFNTSKIQNESNSQRHFRKLIHKFSCVQYVKDTK